MRKLCLDTSAYTRFKAGDAQTIKVVSQARFVGIPTIVLGELRAGFRLGQRCERNESELSAFLDNIAVERLDVDDESSFYYAEIFAELRRKGTPIPTNDMWIAAVAMREGATVLTFDQHFELIGRLSTHRLQ